jgi:hypothetical protein
MWIRCTINKRSAGEHSSSATRIDIGKPLG